jgi:protein-tyrosine-phosphatase
MEVKNMVKKNKTNILFLCKHNVFRSKVAEAYFKKINEDTSLNVSSAGIINADWLTPIERKIVKRQMKIAKTLGINYKFGSRNLKISLLNKQDIIVIVADDVPNIFRNQFYLKPSLEVIRWKIPDVKKNRTSDKFIKKSVMQIIKKVERLVKKRKSRK